MGTLLVKPQIATRSEPVFRPELLAFYDLSDLTTLWKDTARTDPVTADGDAIKGVTDLSGRGAHLLEGTNGPAYKDAIFGYLGAALFNGSSSVLADQGGAAAVAYSGTDKAVTAIYVIKTGATGAQRTPVAWGNSAGTANFVSHHITSGGSDQSQKRDGASATVTATDIDFLLSANTQYLLTKKDTGTTLSFYRNGVAATVNPAAFDEGAMTTDRFALGCLPRSTYVNFYNGHVAACAIFDGALGDSARQAVERYLGNRFGISVS